MVYLNNKCLFPFIVALSIAIFFSCKPNEDAIEKRMVSDFLLVKPDLDEVIMYVVNQYYNSDKVANFNRLQFVLGNKPYNKGSVFSDTLITNKLQQYSIVNISFEKGSFCLDKYAYDFVRFKIKNDSNYQYYYVYEFCSANRDAVDSPNFKSTPLSSNWSLQVERN